MAVGPFLSAPTMRSLFLLATIIRAIATSIAASSDYARPEPCTTSRAVILSPPAPTLAKPSRPWSHNIWFLSHNVKWCSKHIGPRHPSLRSCMIRFQRRFNILSCYTWPSVITCNVDCAYPWILKNNKNVDVTTAILICAYKPAPSPSRAIQAVFTLFLLTLVNN